MPIYMTQFSYTPEAWATLSKNPVDRSEAISGLAQKIGGRLISLYYSFGEYDGLVLFEAPDDKMAAALAIGAALPGHLKAVKTTPLFTTQETMEVLKMVGTTSYQAPSAG